MVNNGYDTQSRIDDLTLLASQNAYGSVPYGALLSSAREVAKDPEVYVTKDGAPSSVPQENREGHIVDMLMTPYYNFQTDRVIMDSMDMGLSVSARKQFDRESSVKKSFGIDDNRWDAMIPWERAYYEQEYNYL